MMHKPKQLIAYLSMLAVALISYVLLYAQTWLDMERVWRSSATYNHCYLIIPISIWLFSRRKSSTVPTAADNSKLGFGLPLLLLCLLQLLYLAGFASGIALLMHIAAVLSLQALLWLALGNQNAKLHCFAIGYLIFLLPFGDELSPLLQHFTADLTVFLLQLAAVPVFREGLYLATPVGLFEVAEACSGLRFLIASIAISVLYAYLTYNKLVKQLLFVFAMVVVSIFANGGRAFMLVYIGEKTNMAYGFGADHFLYGWLFFGAVLMAGFWLGSRFADSNTELHPATLVKPLYQQQHALALPMLAIALLATMLYQQSLPSVKPPLQPATLALPIENSVVPDKSDWGITFVDSLQLGHQSDETNTEYFVAVYANNQKPGKLVSWNNRLFNIDVWFMTDRQSNNGITLLQLKNQAQQYRSVLYWYQIGQIKTSSLAQVKFYQAWHLLSGKSGPASIFAVSAQGPLTADMQRQLQLAAAKLSAQPLINTGSPAL
ncbi:MAG: exosortase [Gammaproteobacteria bacterium]|nr:exosortase [Gammaproteobacteria bacterium]MBU1555300.1 exosortase [Gammaproteobacteria bacterium]MBU2069236.1 exosortase [Gammaproteobacteria bacterium]MBU2182331.1 exosortase [Gammaproteobacteria bacterium]MBU2204897.1 exosortase [Gammaproteobacteria bacterium]